MFLLFKMKRKYAGNHAQRKKKQNKIYFAIVRPFLLEQILDNIKIKLTLNLN